MTTRPSLSEQGVELKLIGPAPDQPAPRRHSTRTKARKAALDILFEAELRGVDALDLLRQRGADHDGPSVREFTADLVEGVVAHRAEIDRRISASLSEGWTLNRMPRVDRTATRLAVFEIDHTELAPEVAVAEAVGLVEELSTDDSPAFVNGVLAKVAATRP